MISWPPLLKQDHSLPIARCFSRCFGHRTNLILLVYSANPSTLGNPGTKRTVNLPRQTLVTHQAGSNAAQGPKSLPSVPSTPDIPEILPVDLFFWTPARQALHLLLTL